MIEPPTVYASAPRARAEAAARASAWTRTCPKPAPRRRSIRFLVPASSGVPGPRRTWSRIAGGCSAPGPCGTAGTADGRSSVPAGPPPGPGGLTARSPAAGPGTSRAGTACLLCIMGSDRGQEWKVPEKVNVTGQGAEVPYGVRTVTRHTEPNPEPLVWPGNCTLSDAEPENTTLAPTSCAPDVTEVKMTTLSGVKPRPSTETEGLGAKPDTDGMMVNTVR